MPADYAGCRRIHDMPYAFNEFGFRAGMSRRLTFEDIGLFVEAMGSSSSCALPPVYRAVLLVFGAPPEDLQVFSSANDTSDARVGMVTFVPEMQQITDVYAFLHAVFNCGIDDAVEPAGALHDLLASCQAVPKPRRGNVLKRAEKLQHAYQAAIKDAIWSSEARSTTPAMGPKPAPAAAATSSSSEAGKAAHGQPRFFVFVQSPATGAVVVIDENKLLPLPAPLSVDRPARGVLCDSVVRLIASIRERVGPDVDSAVFGLTGARDS